MRSVLAMAAAGILLTSVPAWGLVDAGIYYNLSDDPNSLQLLDLDNMDVVQGKTRLNVVDLFRRPNRFGLVSVWEIDCNRQIMHIIQAKQLFPGRRGVEKPIDGKMVNPDSTAPSRTMFGLACRGEGDLAERRVYHGPLQTIMTVSGRGS